jgi:Flp pilus assembly protein TadD
VTSKRTRVAIGATVAVVLACTLGTAWLTLRPKGRNSGTSGHRTARERDVYEGAAARNARPEVAYVGDAVCARCHREITEAYRTHPMGRSLAEIAAATAKPPIGKAAGLPFDTQGLRYSVEERNGRMFHKETKRDADGHVLAEVDAEVRYALGSGTRGLSYLVERDGFLFQSPISWYAQEGRWDLAPGYASSNTHFERPIDSDCLFCHTNRVHRVDGTVNRYTPPIFEGLAIGCERCHGPGGLHVDRGRQPTGGDSTIVNPSSLPPALRESVCEQCHLQGSIRFARAGRETFDFRPGLPFWRFWAVFLRKTGTAGTLEAVGHVEQMELSRCYRASRGELGCISCHDPHRVPAPAEKVAYYRDRCLECHSQKGCALNADARRAKRDDCIACHMPRPTISNIPHTAATDHRILRSTSSAAPKGPREAAPRPGQMLLVDFHETVMSADERREAARDLGVALSKSAGLLLASPQESDEAATHAIPRLVEAIRDRPDDLLARGSLGLAFGVLRRNDDALHAFEEVLRLQPRDELAQRSVGLLLADLHRPAEAVQALEKTIAGNPWHSADHEALAKICFEIKDWGRAIAAGREAVRLNPTLIQTRSLVIQSYLRSGQVAKADEEFRILLAFNPAAARIWRQWYEREKSEAAQTLAH